MSVRVRYGVKRCLAQPWGCLALVPSKRSRFLFLSHPTSVAVYVVRRTYAYRMYVAGPYIYRLAVESVSAQYHTLFILIGRVGWTWYFSRAALRVLSVS